MRNRQFIAVVAATLLSTAGLGVFASTADALFDKAELKCRKSIAKGFLKVLSTGDKVVAGCHKTRDKAPGQIGTDCNDLGSGPPFPAGSADSKKKFEKAQQKLLDTPASKCADLDNTLADLFISCPEPCETDLGLPNPMSTLNEAVQCLACLGGDIIGAKNTATLDSPDPALLSKDDQKCRGAIAKGYAKYLSTILKTRTKCQDGEDKNGAMSLDATCQTSNDPDGKGKIAKALLKAESGVDKKCGSADLAILGSCATTDLTDLKACLAVESDLIDVTAFPGHYQLAATVCPTGVRTTVLAGNGIAGQTVSRLDVGWRGLGHNFDVPDAYSVVLDATCLVSSPPCGVCTTNGIRTSDPNSQLFTRCTNDFTAKCDEPFSLDNDDCGGSFCTYVLGPPVPVSAGGNPSCTINALAADLTGTGNVETGEAAATTNFATKVFTGGSASLTQPCPVCVGDITAADGVQDGICSEGSRDGLPCDTLGYDATFASLSKDLGLSLDCVPPAVENISGTGLKISFELTTGSSSLAADTECDSPLQSEACFCAVCTGDQTLPCINNADCEAALAGSCTANETGITRQPNDCTGFSCDDIGEERGACSHPNDMDMWCEGLVKANGTGFIGCLDNNECVNESFTACENNDCGPCTLAQPRSCFLDPIQTQGLASTGDPVLGGTFCVPPTLNFGINGASGLPGPGRVVVQQSIKRLYD